MAIPPSQPGPQETVTQRARRALREGRLDEARTLAEAGVEEASGSRPYVTASALAILGEVALRRERADDAVEYLEESLRLAERSYTAALLVRALFRRGDWDEGITRCRGFLRSFPQDIYLRTQEVYHCFHEEDYAKAEDLLEKILEDFPDSRMAKSLLIEARTRSASPTERVQELEDLFRIESRRNDPQLRYLQGRNRLEAGDAEGACREYAAAVELEPENGFYRRHLAFALKRAGRLPEAVSALRELFLEDPADRYVRSAFQAVCKASGNQTTLIESIQEALRLHPDMKFLFGILHKARGGRK